jgi:hypothetical protein
MGQANHFCSARELPYWPAIYARCSTADNSFAGTTFPVKGWHKTNDIANGMGMVDEVFYIHDPGLKAAVIGGESSF